MDELLAELRDMLDRRKQEDIHFIGTYSARTIELEQLLERWS